MCVCNLPKCDTWELRRHHLSRTKVICWKNYFLGWQKSRKQYQKLISFKLKYSQSALDDNYTNIIDAPTDIFFCFVKILSVQRLACLKVDVHLSRDKTKFHHKGANISPILNKTGSPTEKDKKIFSIYASVQARFWEHLSLLMFVSGREYYRIFAAANIFQYIFM